jgi:hypothetical protein
MGHGSCRCYSIRTEGTVHNQRGPWRLDSGCSIVLTNLKSSYILKNQKKYIKNKKLFKLLYVRNFVGPGHILSMLHLAWIPSFHSFVATKIL